MKGFFFSAFFLKFYKSIIISYLVIWRFSGASFVSYLVQQTDKQMGNLLQNLKSRITLWNVFAGIYGTIMIAGIIYRMLNA
jgi:hypothetical protein